MMRVILLKTLIYGQSVFNLLHFSRRRNHGFTLKHSGNLLQTQAVTLNRQRAVNGTNPVGSSQPQRLRSMIALGYTPKLLANVRKQIENFRRNA